MIRDKLRKNKYIKSLWNAHSGRTSLVLDYNVKFKPRWHNEHGHPKLDEIISSYNSSISAALYEISKYQDVIKELKEEKLPFSIDLYNGFLPVVDGLSLVWASQNTSNKYIEIGSGNSTLYFKFGLHYFGNSAIITSIDPNPRKEVDAICDEVIRRPVEDLDLSIFDTLEPGDTVFIDNSHRSFMNSDVTVVMLDILPRLSAGVLIGIHDIFLPFDYFETWSERGYNEQYLLACYLLSNPRYFDIKFANYWAFKKKKQLSILENIWNNLGDDRLRDRPGSVFWGVKT